MCLWICRDLQMHGVDSAKNGKASAALGISRRDQSQAREQRHDVDRQHHEERIAPAPAEEILRRQDRQEVSNTNYFIKALGATMCSIKLI